MTIKYEEQRGDYVFSFDTDNMDDKKYSYFQCKCGEFGRVRNDNIKTNYVCKHPRKYLKMQFGNWIVIDIGKRKDGCSLLICRCSCEKSTIRSIPINRAYEYL